MLKIVRFLSFVPIEGKREHPKRIYLCAILSSEVIVFFISISVNDVTTYIYNTNNIYNSKLTCYLCNIYI